MNSLWNDVVSNGSANLLDSGLDATTEASIEERITDDPVDLAVYTSECVSGVIAIEGALAKIEGRCAVDYLRATTESAKAEITATMEGAVGDAWEKLKYYIKKAYKAIKAFLQKLWNKIKAKASVFKAMITKYEKVLRDYKSIAKDISWADFKFDELAKKRNELIGKIDAFAKAHKNADERINENGENSLNYDYNKELKTALWGNEHGPNYEKVSWDSKKAEAIAAADGSVEKIVQDYMNLGEKDERDSENMLRDLEETRNDKYDDAKSDKSKIKMDIARSYVRAKIAVNHMFSNLLSSGALAYRNQCVAACRKAISKMHGVKESYAPATESSLNLDAIMAEML